MGRTITTVGTARYGVGDAARLSGVHLETIRYYERIRLIPPAGRGSGGRRLFTEAEVHRLGFIRQARDMGFSQDEVRALLALSAGEVVSCGEVKAIAERHLAATRRRLGDLRKLERLLAATVAQCSGGTAPVCPVIEAIGRRRP
jgi:MerR family mercuric resistance operon transcriptional regulator